MSTKIWTCLVVAFVCFIGLLLYVSSGNNGTQNTDSPLLTDFVSRVSGRDDVPNDVIGLIDEFTNGLSRRINHVEMPNSWSTDGWKDEVFKIMKDRPDVDNNEIDKNIGSISKIMQYCEEEGEIYKAKYVSKDPNNMGERRRRRVVFMLTPGANFLSCVVTSYVEVLAKPLDDSSQESLGEDS
eukprot:49725_1